MLVCNILINIQPKVDNIPIQQTNNKIIKSNSNLQHQMSMSVVQNSFQVIPPQQPSTQHKGVYLHQSIIKGFKLNESHVPQNNINNNSIPLISTDMLNTLNPKAFSPIKQSIPSFGQTNYHRVISSSIRPLSQNSKARVNFSYGLNSHNINIGGNSSLSPGRNGYGTGFGMKIVSKRANNFFGDQPRHSSLSNKRPFSNLSELSKSKKAYPQIPSLPNSTSLNQFITYKSIHQNNQQIKIHKLGKKFKNVKFSHNTIQKSGNGATSVKFIPNNNHNNNKHLYKVETPRKNNMSMLSMERSEYVFLPQENGQRIQIAPQSYVFSQNVIMSRPIITKSQQKQINNRITTTEHSLVLPMEQKSDLSSINIRDNQQHYILARKFPTKIHNKVYLEETEGLRTIQEKGSRLAELESINKLSRIRAKGNNQHQGFAEPNGILSRQDLNEIDDMKVISRQDLNEQADSQVKPRQDLIILGDKKGSNEQNQLGEIFQKALQKQQNFLKQGNPIWQQNQKLLSKISDLEEKLHLKEQENANLLRRLQTQQIYKKIHCQYQKLQLITKLNQIQIKKLKNEIKMFQIRQKFFLNTEQEKNHQINQLKDQLEAINKRKWGHLAHLKAGSKNNI